jgi:hypothetical protein
VARVLCGDMCHPDLVPFGALSVHFLVTRGTHATGPRHPKWRQPTMSSLGVCDSGGVQVSISEKCRRLKSRRHADRRSEIPSGPFSTVGSSRGRMREHFGGLSLQGSGRLRNGNILEPRSTEILKCVRIVHPNA